MKAGAILDMIPCLFPFLPLLTNRERRSRIHTGPPTVKTCSEREDINQIIVWHRYILSLSESVRQGLFCVQAMSHALPGGRRAPGACSRAAGGAVIHYCTLWSHFWVFQKGEHILQLHILYLIDIFIWTVYYFPADSYQRITAAQILVMIQAFRKIMDTFRAVISVFLCSEKSKTWN